MMKKTFSTNPSSSLKEKSSLGPVGFGGGVAPVMNGERVPWKGEPVAVKGTPVPANGDPVAVNGMLPAGV
jgi:hypothetical protein